MDIEDDEHPASQLLPPRHPADHTHRVPSSLVHHFDGVDAFGGLGGFNGVGSGRRTTTAGDYWPDAHHVTGTVAASRHAQRDRPGVMDAQVEQARDMFRSMGFNI